MAAARYEELQREHQALRRRHAKLRQEHTKAQPPPAARSSPEPQTPVSEMSPSDRRRHVSDMARQMVIQVGPFSP